MMYWRCPHCKEKIEEKTDQDWLYECDICGKEAKPCWDRENGSSFTLIRKGQRAELVNLRHVCAECEGELEEKIKDLIEKERRQLR